MSRPIARSTEIPWQYSQSLGGEYVWNPQTDEIILRTGDHYARPPHVQTTALQAAIYVGPLPSFRYDGSPPSDPGFSLSSRPGPSNPSQSGSLMQGFNIPRTESAGHGQVLSDAVSRITVAPRGTTGKQPAVRPVGKPKGPPPRPLRNIPQGDTQVVFQPATGSQIARNEPVRQPDENGRMKHIGNPDVTTQLFPGFKIRKNGKKYFRVGRIFLVLWSENAGGTVATRYVPGITLNHLGERVFSKVRRFVVIREGHNFCHALPINTYGGRGVAKPGVVKSDHVIIYSGRAAPTPQRGELPPRGQRGGMRPIPIQVESDEPTNALDPMSRLNLAGVTLVQHNIKVLNFGKVCDGSVNALREQFENVWETPLPVSQPVARSVENEDSGNDEENNTEESGDDEGDDDNNGGNDDEEEEEDEGNDSGNDTS